MELYKGYIATKGKRATEKLKGRTNWKSLDDVKCLDGYAGVLADDTVLVDVDDSQQSEIMMQIIEHFQLDCRVYQTTRGKHFLFKNHSITRNRTHVQLAVGIVADIKIGSRTSYEVIKIDGVERFCEWDVDDGKYQEIPKYFLPVGKGDGLLDLGDGDGRNQALFNYILRLQASGFSIDEIRETLRITNRFVLKEPLPDEEMETILRDEAFQRPVFYDGKTFLFDTFARYLKANLHVVKIYGQLHIYHDGSYVHDDAKIEQEMINLIPNLKKTQRREVLDYLQLIADEESAMDARYVAFANGVLDISTGEIQAFSPSIVVTNKIDWNYYEDAYSELADTTLDKLACYDEPIRLLLEECIGYCFYRRNELGKAFVLTGDKQNGKSTFLDCIKNVLGENNICALDLKELGDRFTTSMMFGKLANIGDDIGDDFLQGTQLAIFKKVVTGNRIKAERKGVDPFEFNPFVKMLFSANDMPRMKDKTGAVLRRLVIIPFNARFTKDDPDYNPFIRYELASKECMEYFVNVGVQGLMRVLQNQEFTKSDQVEQSLKEYEEENNPIIGFIAEEGEEMIVNQATGDVYRRYQLFCADNTMQPMSNIAFSKQIVKRLGLQVTQKKICGKNRRIFVKL